MTVTPVVPGTLVPAPTRAALPYGLFSVVTPRAEGDGRWQSGIEFETQPCPGELGAIGAFDCDDPAATVGIPKTLDARGSAVGEGTPFTLYGHFNCSPIGWSPEAAQAMADADLLRGEEAGAEAAFWTGALGNVANLAGVGMDDAPTVVTGGDVAVSVGALEDYLGAYHQAVGIIHMTRSMAVAAIAADVVEVRSGRLYTVLGTPVVAGAGYPGTAPDGNASVATTWMYATGPMVAYRSDIFTSSSVPGDLLTRGTNDLFAVAERTYVLGIDPCGVGAVEVA